MAKSKSPPAKVAKKPAQKPVVTGISKAMPARPKGKGKGGGKMPC